MFYVYILYSLKDQKLYVGCSQDLDERLKDHNQGRVDATKHRRPLVRIYTEEFLIPQDAYAREKNLKSLWSSRFKKKIKKQYESRLKP